MNLDIWNHYSSLTLDSVPPAVLHRHALLSWQVLLSLTSFYIRSKYRVSLIYLDMVVAIISSSCVTRVIMLEFSWGVTARHLTRSASVVIHSCIALNTLNTLSNCSLFGFSKCIQQISAVYSLVLQSSSPRSESVTPLASSYSRMCFVRPRIFFGRYSLLNSLHG